LAVFLLIHEEGKSYQFLRSENERGWFRRRQWFNTISEHASISGHCRTSLSEVRTLILTVYGTECGDNSGAIELAKVPKMYPRTKHVNTKNHHFKTHGAERVDPGRLSSGGKLSSVSCAS
jgi:hypothetical protein